MMTAERTQAQELAAAFSRIIREWLTEEELAEVNRKNATDPSCVSGSVCASHDFCDSNQAMLDAFEEVVGREWHDEEPIDDVRTPEQWDRDDALIDEAWAIAKADGFSETL